MKILIIESNKHMLEAMAQTLASAGHEVTCSHNRSLLTKESDFDLVISNLNNWFWDVRTICQLLNKKLLLVSGHVNIQNHHDNILPKPFIVEELLKKVEGFAA